MAVIDGVAFICSVDVCGVNYSGQSEACKILHERFFQGVQISIIAAYLW